MVYTKRLLSLSLLLSLAAVFSISAVNTANDAFSIDNIDEFDMTEATLAFLPEVVRTDGLGEDVDLFYDNDGFFVRTSDEDVRVQSHDTDKPLRDLSKKDLIKYAAMGKFKVSKFDTGEYAVRSCGELKGGGPVLAACGAIGTRVIGYGGWAVCALTIPGFAATGAHAFASIELAANYATAVGLTTPSI